MPIHRYRGMFAFARAAVHVRPNRGHDMYTEKFPAGSSVLIAKGDALEHFRQTWKLHNPLLPEQLAFAGSRATIASVGFYHGGDVLYVLEGVPGVWHESCLTKS
jgi:hypothetical protein